MQIKILITIILCILFVNSILADAYKYPNDPKEFIKLMENKFPDSKTRLNELNTLVFDLYHYGFTISGATFFGQVLNYMKNLIDQTNEKQYLPDYYYMYANICFQNSIIDSSIYYHKKTIEFAKKYNKNDLVIHAIISLGVQNNYYSDNYLLDLIPYLKIGYEKLHKTNDDFARASGNWSMMEYHLKSTKNKDSIKYYENEARKYLNLIPDERFPLKNFGFHLIEQFKTNLLTKNRQNENEINQAKFNLGIIIKENLNRKLINFDRYLNLFLAQHYNSIAKNDSAKLIINNFINSTNIYQKEYLLISKYYYELYLQILSSEKNYKEALETTFIIDNINKNIVDNSENVERLAQLRNLEKIAYDEKIKTEEQRRIFIYVVILLITISSIIIIYLLYSRYKKIKILNFKLDEANNTKNKLFRIISHDLNGPANSTLILSEQIGLYFDKMSKEDFAKTAKLIHKSSFQLKAILDTLIQWSKLNFDGFKVSKKNVIVIKIIDEIIEDLSYLINSKSIEIISEIENDLSVLFNEDALRVIIRNILSNAIKFTPANQQIVISAKDDYIKITDGGNGFPIEILSGNIKNIDSKAGTNNETGLGLGLQIVKDITEKYDAKIEFTNNNNGNGEVILQF